MQKFGDSMNVTAKITTQKCQKHSARNRMYEQYEKITDLLSVKLQERRELRRQLLCD